MSVSVSANAPGLNWRCLPFEGLSVTELGRYSRTLNGVKSEYKGEQFSYSVFASETAQSFRRDEIQGDGTSGLYRLTARDIVPNFCSRVSSPSTDPGTPTAR